ncbi:MAG: FtsW/RodA/SpoVE family cell cycle protein, partial [Anaerolineaceae bacterium]|nr:FtsW/RodA/SpoVE family cell cycle protein [Anaerolineaceae bacterium]
MQKIFHKPGRPPKMKNHQTNLMILAALFLFAYAVALTIAPSVRSRTWAVSLNWNHWIGYLVWLVGFSILNNQVNHLIKDPDPLLVPVVGILSGLGILTIWRLNPELGEKQTLWLFISLMTILLALRIPNLLEFIRRYKYLWMFLGLFITSLTFIFGVNPINNGPRLWLQFSNFYFQPSEPLKLLLIIFLASYFADRNKFHGNFFRIILPTLVMSVLTFGILISQRDIGTASIFVLVYLIMLLLATQKKRLFWLIPLILILAGMLGFFLLDIVKLRIFTWIDPWSTSTTTSYQIVQALIAIASGGIGGTGPGLGSPGLIPVVESDFIFSAISEEMGLLGTFALIILLIVLMLRTIKISVSSRSTFHRYLSLGLASYFAIQSFLIIGGNLGLLPLTGVTLPFISYGGSSLLTNFLCLLLLLIISGEEKQIPPSIATARPINTLGILFSVLFLLTLLANSWISVVKRSETIDRPENPRWIIYDRYIPRGNIYSQNGNLIASTQGQIGSYSR